MKRLLLFLLLASGAYGQSLYHYENILLNQNGTPITGANIYVCTGNVVPNFTATPPCPTATIYNDVAGASPITQPTNTSPLGNYAFYLPGGLLYTVVFTGTGLSGYDTITPPLFPGNILSNINNIVLVDGVTYPHTNAGIQSAVNATPDGGTVFLPPGTYTLTGTGSEEILISKKINFVCSGWGTILQVDSSVPGTTDIIHINPAGLVQGLTVQDCYITPVSGTPGRHGISIDGTTSTASNMRIIHNRIDALGGKSIAVINATGQSNGTPYASTFKDNVTLGGWDFTNAGDSVNIENNVMTGSGGFIWFPVGATVHPASNGGAHGFRFEGNNYTNTGGIYIGNGWQGTIAYNNIEVAGLTETNAGCIDVDGNSAGNIENFKIIGNFIACANGGSAIAQVRVNRANATVISQNYVARATGTSYTVTSSANSTLILNNRQSPSGELITTWLSDSGTGTSVDFTSTINASRLVEMGAPIATGTKAVLTGTGSCITITAQLGGPWAGQVQCTGITGASTLIITPGYSAPNGWSCWANDTTAGTALHQSTGGPTGCTIAGTVTANDVLTFGAVAY